MVRKTTFSLLTSISSNNKSHKRTDLFLVILGFFVLFNTSLNAQIQDLEVQHKVNSPSETISNSYGNFNLISRPADINTSQGINSSQIILDGNYCPGPGQLGDEYGDALTFIPDSDVTGTCEILQIWANVDIGDESLRLAFKNGNGGSAIFRIYIDADNNPNTGLISDFLGTPKNKPENRFSVPGAEYILQINASSGETKIFKPEFSPTSTTMVPSNEFVGFTGKNGNSNGCPGSDSQFLEFYIPFGDIIDLCDQDALGELNLASYAAVSGGSITSNLCSNEPLNFSIDLSGTVSPSHSVCLGENGDTLTLNLGGDATNSTVEYWEVSTEENGTYLEVVDQNTEGSYTYAPSSNVLTTSTTYYFRARISNSDLNCTYSSGSASITVNDLPTVTAGSYGPVCVDSADIALVGIPAGGVWSGTGVSGTTGNYVFDPSQGTQTLTYTYTDTQGTTCTNTDTTTITVNDLPEAPTVTGTGEGDQMECETSPMQTLTAKASAPSGYTVLWYETLTGGTPVSPTLNTFGTKTYYAEAVNNTTDCKSTSRTPVELEIQAAPEAPTVTGTGEGDQTECETSPIQTLTATATAPSGAVVVWYDAETNGTIVSDPSLTGVGTATYWAESSNTDAKGCVSLTRTKVELEIYDAPDAPLSGGDQAECLATPTQTLTATATAPSGAVVVWYDAETNGTVVSDPSLTGVGTATYWAESSNTDTKGCVSLTRTKVELEIYDAPDAPLSGGDQAECLATPTQTLTATATAPPGAVVVWYDAETNGTVVSDPSLTGVGTATYWAESSNTDAKGCVSLTRTKVELEIYDAPDAPLSGGDQAECLATPTQTLTATATAPSGAVVVWYDAETNGTIVSDPSLTGVGTATYWAESSNTDAKGCVSLTRTKVELEIYDAPDAPLSGGDQAECLATPTQTLTATATAPPGAVVVWYDAETNGTVVSDPSLTGVGTATYWAESSNTDTKGCVSLTRTKVELEIYDAPDAPLSGGDQAECLATPTQTLTATATAPPGAVVVWYDAETNGTVVSDPSLTGVGTATYWAESSNTDAKGCVSLTRTKVELEIYDAPDAPLSGGDQAECLATPTQTLTATATAPSGAVVVWYDAETNGTVVSDPSLTGVGTATYWAESSNTDTKRCVSLTRTKVELEIYDAPDAPLSGGDQAECLATPTQTLTATATAPPGAVVVWYDAETNGTVVSDPSLTGVGTATYWAESSNTDAKGCVSLTRTKVELEIYDAPDAPLSGGDQAECLATPTQTLTATATAPSGAVVVWYDAETNGTIVSDPSLTGVGTATYWAESSNTDAKGCVSLTRTKVELEIYNTPDAPTSENQTVCADGDPNQTLTAAASGDQITWYDAPEDGNVVENPTQVGIGNSTYYAENYNGICTSLTRTRVTLSITKDPEAPVSNGDIVQCEQSPIQILDANDALVSTVGITWYDAATDGNVVNEPTLNNVDSITYYAQYEDENCKSVTRTPVTLEIQAAPEAPTVTGTGEGDQTECETSPIQTLTAKASAPSGYTVLWYESLTGGTPVSPTLSSVGTKTYYAEAVNNTTDCKSTSRTPVKLEIQAAPEAPTVTGTGEGDQTECETSPIQTLTAKASAPSGYTVLWYESLTGGTPVSPTLSSVGTKTYYAEAVNNTTDCKSTSRTPVKLEIQAAPEAPTVTGTGEGDQTECETSPIQTLTAKASAPSGYTVLWYETLTGGTPVSPTLSSVGTKTYYAEAVNNTTDCKSTSRTPVELEIQAAPEAPTVTNPGEGNQTVCADGDPNQTLTAAASGNQITWYDAPEDGNVVENPTQVGIGNSTYYAENYNGICTSLTRTRVTLSITKDPEAPVSNGDIVQCEQNPIQILDANDALVSTVGITWYDAATDGNVVNEPTLNNVDSITYYAQYEDENCKSVTRTPVTLEIIATPLAPIVDASLNTTCSLNNGEIKILVIEGIEYSIDGENYVISGEFNNLAPDNYFITARFINGDCISSSTEVEIIAIPDTEDPVLSTVEDITVNVEPGVCGAIVSFNDPTATDNCTGTVVRLNEGSLASGSEFPVGTTTVTYTATDAAGNTDDFSFTVTVEDNEDPTIECPENITVTNLEGQNYAIVTYSEITFSDNCGVTIERTSGFASGEQFPVGTTTVTYIATDASGNTTECSFTVLVKGKPVAEDDIVTTDEDVPVIINVLLNDSDPDDDDLTIVSNTETSNGTLVLNGNGTFTYTPDENYNGPDSFTYTITDGNEGFDTATVSITVNPINDGPNANDDEASTDEDNAVTVSVLDNDSDVDEDGLTVVSTTDPNNGSVVINDNGTITYTPDPDFNGEDSFTYTISDGNGGTDTATVTISVNAVNDAPVAVDDEATTDEDNAVTVSVLENDSDVDGDGLTVVSTTDPSNGSVVINDDGTITYTPDPDFNGEDSFTYTISDGNGGTDTATVTITVNAVNDAPIANDDVATVDEDNAVTIPVLDNDEDVDGDGLTVVSTTDPSNGTVVINNDGTITYTPDPDFNGTDSFTYTVSDGNGGTDTATVTITINPVDDQPDPPIIVEVVQPTCEIPTGTITVETIEGLTYSVNGVDYQESGVFSDLEPGTYEVTAQTEGGLTSEVTSIVIEEPLAAIIVTRTDEPQCNDGGTYDLFDLLVGEFDRTGTWENPNSIGILNGSILELGSFGNDFGTYTFNYVLSGNCPSTTAVEITIINCIVLNCSIDDIRNSISKAVTPNGDGFNDFFNIGIDLECGFTFDVQIFNRWGAEIYTMRNYQNNWDGFSDKSFTSSNQLPSGTYYYIIEINGASGLGPIQGYIFLGTK